MCSFLAGMRQGQGVPTGTPRPFGHSSQLRSRGESGVEPTASPAVLVARAVCTGAQLPVAVSVGVSVRPNSSRFRATTDWPGSMREIVLPGSPVELVTRTWVSGTLPVL